jgi:hypothetical protein
MDCAEADFFARSLELEGKGKEGIYVKERGIKP